MTRISRLFECTAIGLAMDILLVARADVLYVSNYTNPGEIDWITSVGTKTVFATLPADSSYPSDLAFDGNRNLYVANDITRQISKITSDGTVSVFVTMPSGSSPVGVAFDNVGNLFVSDFNHDLINKVTPSGTISFFASLPPGSSPADLVFDSSGNLYSADYGTGDISKITPAGAVSPFASLPSGTSPFGLAFDKAGNLYAADVNERLFKITPGARVSVFTMTPATDVAFDSSGNLYTAAGGSVNKITPTGTVTLFCDTISSYFIAVTDDAGHPLALPPTTLLGDDNLDGVVDAADYVVWRRGLGTIYNQADYNVWRTHFGQTAGSGGVPGRMRPS